MAFDLISNISNFTYIYTYVNSVTGGLGVPLMFVMLPVLVVFIGTTTIGGLGLAFMMSTLVGAIVSILLTGSGLVDAYLTFVFILLFGSSILITLLTKQRRTI